MDDVVNAEKKLVVRAKTGDTYAFEQLYRSYNQRIYNFARQVVGSDQDASDVVQDTFIRVWQSLPKLRSEDAFKGWLYKITLSRCKELLCRKPKNTELSIDECLCVGDDIGSGSDRPERITIERELMSALDDAVRELSPDHRAVIAMHHLDGMDVSDIAETLDVPLGTVLSRLARARTVLRRKLAPYVENT